MSACDTDASSSSEESCVYSFSVDVRRDLTMTSKPSTADSTKKKISAEELEKLTQRIYADSMKRKQESVEKLEKKIYKEIEPKKLPASQIQASAVRQHDDELERRKKSHEALQQKFYKEAEAKKLSRAEIDDSVRRVYADAMRSKNEGLKKLEDRFSFHRPSSRPLTADQVKASADRLCKPSKRAFTEAEINEILGFH
jgi:hypothetical protein